MEHAFTRTCVRSWTHARVSREKRARAVWPVTLPFSLIFSTEISTEILGCSKKYVYTSNSTKKCPAGPGRILSLAVKIDCCILHFLENCLWCIEFTAVASWQYLRADLAGCENNIHSSLVSSSFCLLQIIFIRRVTDFNLVRRHREISLLNFTNSLGRNPVSVICIDWTQNICDIA